MTAPDPGTLTYLLLLHLAKEPKDDQGAWEQWQAKREALRRPLGDLLADALVTATRRDMQHSDCAAVRYLAERSGGPL